MKQKMYKLSSKAKLVLNQVEGAELFCVEVLIASGYAEEKANKEGITYLLSRMLLSGTSNYKGKDSVQLKIKAMGGKIVTEVQEEYIKIALTVPRERAISAVSFIAELIFDFYYEDEDFEIEKSMAIIEQEKYDQNPNFTGKQYLKFLAFKRTGLCNSPFGKPKTLEKLTIEDMGDYFIKIVHPKNMVISCAGSFNEEEMITAVEESFGSNAAYDVDARVEKYVPAIANRDEFIKSKVRNLFQTRFFLGFRAPAYTDFNKYYISIFLQMMEFFSKKYFASKPYFFGVSTENLSFANNGLAIIHFMCNHEEAMTTLQEFNNCLQKTKNTLLPEFFEIEKKNLIGEVLRDYDSMEEIATKCGVQHLYTKKPYDIDEVLTFINDMTFEEYRKVVQQYISPDKMYMSYVGKKVNNAREVFDF